ncbi:serine/threonine protein kinase [Micromonospora craterilacus]|uniref:non-specific serine/threonine protein kinase n=2 Tax=Micromonospora craterilacus TaxID=1655439 RepID=A0A2W2ESE3_9ACTN|nr:serine/threonine protein kinase [Micromonospora craterilacus]
MGAVWRASDEVLHREVAVKQVVLPAWLGGDARDQLRARTLREARTAARLSHPNVVRVYDVVSDAGTPWIVMEYVPSRTLQDVIDGDGPLPPHRAARIGLALLDALRAAHDAGVLHRDVKPQNVLVADDGRVLLTDFGLAVFDGGDGAMTGSGTVLGSPQYVAPERAAEGVSSAPADLWSLGATLHAAVEGRSPYARSTAMATLSALASAPPDPAPHAGPLAPVLAGLLQRDPADRADHTEARRRLVAAAGSDPTEPGTGGAAAGRPDGPGEPPHRPATAPPVPRESAPNRDRVAVARPWALAAVAMLVAAAAGIGTALTVVGTGAFRPHQEAAVLPPGAPPYDVDGPHQPGGNRPPGPPPGQPGGPGPPPLPCVRPWIDGEPVSATAPAAGERFRPPAGWAWHADASGFRVAVPAGWRYSRDGDVACFQDPATGRALSVAAETDSTTAPAARLRAVRDRELAAGTLPAYQEFRLGRVGAGTEWEFGWLTPHGDRLRATQIAPDRPARGRSWTLGWITRESDWKAAAGQLATARASFRPGR